MQHSEKSIVVDREVRFPEFMIVPHAILRTSDSGFVVAGGFGGARAIATSSVGDMLWTYVDDADPTNGVQSEFKSVVQLANGNFLFCGSKTTSDSRQVKHQLSMVTELDQHGKLVESRIGTKPNNNPLYESSDIYQCMRWNEGIAVIGLLFDGVQSQSWLMKLDSNGAKEWDRILPKMPVPWGAETIDHSLVLSTYRTATFESLFTIVNVQGEVMATRSFKNAGFLPLRSAALRKTNSMISYGSGKSTLYTLNDHLSDHEAPKTIPNFIAEEGCGYINADDSITLFGRSTNAAVAWIDASGATIVTRTLDDKRPSFVIDDAVPVSENQFVTVRTTRGASAADQGLAMNWITIK